MALLAGPTMNDPAVGHDKRMIFKKVAQFASHSSHFHSLRLTASSSHTSILTSLQEHEGIPTRTSPMSMRPATKKARIYLVLFLAAQVVAVAGHSLSYEPHTEPDLPLSNRLPFKLQRRYRQKNNIPSGYIFNKHLRKCGGTTLRAYLEDVTLYYHNLRQGGGQLGNVTYYEQEAYAMDWQCPKHDARRWRDSLSVIALRHPVERHLSEFFYSGPGRLGRLNELHKEGNYGDGEFARLLRIELPKWMEEGMVVTRKRGCLRRHFSDEFQVRALSAELTPDGTGPLPYYHPKPECSVHRLANGTFEKNAQCGNCNIFCDGPCSYGDHWRGGIRGGHTVTEESLERAKTVLGSFDIVLITETMSGEDAVLMMADVTGVPLDNGSIRRDEKNIGLHASDRATATAEQRLTYYQSILKEAEAADMLELIEKHSQYEMLLYDEAIRLNQKIIEQWKEERKSQFESQS